MRDHIVKLAGDPVALLDPHPIGQPGLGDTQLVGEVALPAGQQGADRREHRAGDPRSPTGIIRGEQPLQRDDERRRGPQPDRDPGPHQKRGPANDHAEAEPAHIGRLAVAEHDHAGRGQPGEGRAQQPAGPG